MPDNPSATQVRPAPPVGRAQLSVIIAMNSPGFGQDEKKASGRGNPLKKLDPDKEIKVNSFDCLWPGLAGFG
jgi:hypothetical protein